ncbi:uncharacterized protein FN964_013740 [Alca torda]
MKEEIQRLLVPLFFRTKDQTESVAKASEETLLTCANFLNWKKLKQLVQTKQTWRIGEALLVQDRRRVEEYLQHSMPYLKDAQATLREEAIRFIGEPPPPRSLVRSLAPVPATGLAARISPVAARALAAPRRAWAAEGSVPSSLTPAHAGGLAGSLALSHRPRGLSFPGASPAEGQEGVRPSCRAGGRAAGVCWGAGGLTKLCA